LLKAHIKLTKKEFIDLINSTKQDQIKISFYPFNQGEILSIEADLNLNKENKKEINSLLNREDCIVY